MQIRNLPAEVHEILRRRAAGEGVSLQEYLLRLLLEHARRPTGAEPFDCVDARVGGSLDGADAARLVRDERDDRRRSSMPLRSPWR